MGRAWQIERQLDREEARLEKQLNDGSMSRAEYNDEMRQLQRDAREAYEQDLEDAQRAVRDEWGW
jgi:hypothetical protein